MKSIKQFIRTPQSHEIKIKIPQYVPENDIVELILILNRKHNNYEHKINDLKTAMNDELFLRDLKKVSDEFKEIDLAEWEE